MEKIDLTNEILKHPLNSGVSLLAGEYDELEGPQCPQPKPTVPPGQYGEYVCVNGEWVFIGEV